MSDQLSVEEIDDVELPGLDSNQIPRVLLAIKSMNDEQGQRIIQRLDPSKDNRIQNFGTSINGVLWSHVEGAPNEYMCRACVNDKPESFNTYDLDDFDAHFSKKHVVEPKSLDDSIKSSYGQYLGPRPGYNHYP
ncbi:hypothetical protein FOC4_g10005343 [Fusarium odoratissimum]|uniref:Uncharacterized protein n=1 Tax=Fusarium oxysporum f. sp. cubense (strain race 4) TaxID=2502994 RepID=N1RL32_FUSC4|nr:hypothetical protein FOC4_g10005343 [Fusarium odoratissimum]